MLQATVVFTESESPRIKSPPRPAPALHNRADLRGSGMGGEARTRPSPVGNGVAGGGDIASGIVDDGAGVRWATYSAIVAEGKLSSADANASSGGKLAGTLTTPAVGKGFNNAEGNGGAGSAVAEEGAKANPALPAGKAS